MTTLTAETLPVRLVIIDDTGTPSGSLHCGMCMQPILYRDDREDLATSVHSPETTLTDLRAAVAHHVHRFHSEWAVTEGPYAHYAAEPQA